MTRVDREFERLAAVFTQLGTHLNRQPPASEAAIASVAEITGVEVASELKDFWRISNGSGHTMWFAEGEDEFTPYYFLSIEDALENWQRFAPYDAGIYEHWYDDEEWGKRDSRIQRHYLRHKDWVSFAEFNGGSHLLMFDADPTANGKHGQIINYLHDPDGIFWTSTSFIDFLVTSNDMLEKWLEDPDQLREQLWLWD
jgi:cell wall assembly regulator SMI1